MHLYLQLLLSFLIAGRSLLVSAQDETGNLNFCDIPCVSNVYRAYCGQAKCTTGASDYGQVFTLCTSTCVSAVIGEAMHQCLTTTAPERADWDDVQLSVLDEIVTFCEGFQITLDPAVRPLPLAETDPKLLDTLFDEPTKKEKKKRKTRGSKKRKPAGKKGKKDEEEDEEEEPKAKTKTRRRGRKSNSGEEMEKPKRSTTNTTAASPGGDETEEEPVAEDDSFTEAEAMASIIERDLDVDENFDE